MAKYEIRISLVYDYLHSVFKDFAPTNQDYIKHRSQLYVKFAVYKDGVVDTNTYSNLRLVCPSNNTGVVATKVSNSNDYYAILDTKVVDDTFTFILKDASGKTLIKPNYGNTESETNLFRIHVLNYFEPVYKLYANPAVSPSNTLEITIKGKICKAFSNNSLTVSYQCCEETEYIEDYSYETVSDLKWSGNSYSKTFEIDSTTKKNGVSSAIDGTKSYIVRFRFAEAMTTYVIQQRMATISSSMPLFDWGKNDFDFHTKVKLTGKDDASEKKMEIGTTETTNRACIELINSSRTGRLTMSDEGNFGLYDVSNGEWVLRSVNNEGRRVIIPQILHTNEYRLITPDGTYTYPVARLNTDNDFVIGSTASKSLFYGSSFEANNHFVLKKDGAEAIRYELQNDVRRVRFTLGATGTCGLYDVAHDKYIVSSALDGDTNINSMSTDVKINATNTLARNVMPQVNATGSSSGYNLGDGSHRWKAVYSQNSTIQTSDRNYKTDIQPIVEDETLDAIYDELIPVSYFSIGGDRQKWGFIAQDVEAGFNKHNKTINDYSVLCRDDYIDEEGVQHSDYALRYTEFIALNTNQIQKLKKRVNALEQENRELSERLTKIERMLEVQNGVANDS